MIAGVFAVLPILAQAQFPGEQVLVKRPDGTMVLPLVKEVEPPLPSWDRSSAVRAEERERVRMDYQDSVNRRLENSAREREAAYQNPGRQIAPTEGR